MGSQRQLLGERPVVYYGLKYLASLKVTGRSRRSQCANSLNMCNKQEHVRDELRGGFIW